MGIIELESGSVVRFDPKYQNQMRGIAGELKKCKLAEDVYHLVCPLGCEEIESEQSTNSDFNLPEN